MVGRDVCNEKEFTMMDHTSRLYEAHKGVPATEVVPIALIGTAEPGPDQPLSERLKPKADEILRLYHQGITGVVMAAVKVFQVKQEIVGGAVGADKVELYKE